MARSALLLLAAVALLAGCVSPRATGFAVDSPERRAAAAVLAAVEASVGKAGVRDSGAFPVQGFPYLRADGYLAGLRDRLDAPARVERWIELLRERDRDGRGREVANLPRDSIEHLAGELGLPADRRALAAAADRAADQLLGLDRGAPGFLEALRGAVTHRQEYSTARRVLGLYALASIPVAVGTRNAYGRFRRWHGGALAALPVRGELLAYAPASRRRFDRAGVERLYRALPRDAFGAPVPDNTALAELFLAYAPVVVQDTAGEFDRIGEVRWDADRVLVGGPAAAYRYATFTLLRGEPALQLNYAFWYPARAGAAPRLEHGPFDGFTLRVTLGPDGLPAVVDTTNNCGCYYFAVPRADIVERVLPTALGDEPLVPARLPDGYPAEPLHLRLASGWHQTQHLDAAPVPPGAVPYRLLPYEELESLPREDGRRESVFDAEGILKGSTRIEPYVFFSMGIPSVGSMRQRGHHPIALVGRKHFTEAGLLDGMFAWR